MVSASELNGHAHREDSLVRWSTIVSLSNGCMRVPVVYVVGLVHFSFVWTVGYINSFITFIHYVHSLVTPLYSAPGV